MEDGLSDVRVAVVVASCALFAAALHAWLGPRHLLPRLFSLPAFKEVLTPTPRVRRGFLVAWHMTTVGILAFGALIPTVELVQDRASIQALVFVLSVLMCGSSIIVWSYLGLRIQDRFRLRDRTRHFGMWFSVLLWVLLAVVVVTAWRAAEPDANDSVAPAVSGS